MRIIGMNSGTSVDGIDLALCEFTNLGANENGTGKLGIKIIEYSEYTHKAELRKRILSIINKEQGGLADLTQLNFMIGHAFADAIDEFLKEKNLTYDDFDVVASHGQTMWHQVDASSEVKSTLQMGESAIIMKRTGKTVVSDMRVTDMAYGGQGAPLTSFFDVVLCAEDGKTHAFQNFGGISNTTIISMNNGNVDAIAFDQGPANVLIDHAIRHYTNGASNYDKDGEMARRGKVNQELLDELLGHPYYKLPAPKTTGRELFSDAYAEGIIKIGEERGLSPEDIVATLTELTVASVVGSYKDFTKSHIDEIIVHGGGSFNPVIMEGIERGLPGTVVSKLTMERTGLPAACKEAAMFALIGHECIHGRPGQIPSCTGASQTTPLGKITPGSNYLDIIRKVVDSGVKPGDKTTRLVVSRD
ncbi:hypothetical protein BB559_005252 [Furculomyces boomerangus]|uniref:Anhydro-N-acetylmuramic acid kinase n=2 Tax=Harpellales TaxID=61421 RepID=A0A2T9Y9Q3_9FUNG|nr:hypothetical protein BB559_005252 [Furculomyces boomerangus]PVZ98899.1 hypothetical protein BB558_005100 [Smittium angustum]